MILRKLKKKSKSIVALATLATLSLGILSSLYKGIEVDATIKDTQKYRNVMYYGDWSIWEGQKKCMPSEIPVDKLTHLNFAFMDFNAQGELEWTDLDAATGHGLGYEGVTYGDLNGGIINAFQMLKLDNPNLKIGLSLGGWSKSGDFTAVSKNPTIRAKFVKNVCDFIRYTNMDFVDIDWEYPASPREPDLCDNSRDEGTRDGSPADKEYFIALLQEFRTALDKQGKELGKKYELTAALPAPIAKLEAGIDLKRTFELLDFGNMMTYDMRGAWDDNAGHQSGLYTNPNDPLKGYGLSIDECVQYLLSKGVPSEKIVIGACFYTRGWEKVSNDKVDPNSPGLFGKAEKCTMDADFTKSYGAYPEAPLKDGEGGRMTGTWSYNSLDALKKKYPNVKEYWDDIAKAPYLYAENGAFFTYDNQRSIAEKTKYVKEQNLGGVISWMASQDAKTETGKRDELTNAIYRGLYGEDKLPEYHVDFERLDLSVTTSFGPAQFGTGSSLKITVTNNSKTSASGEVLSRVEKVQKSLKNAKLYIETDGFKIVGREYPTPEVKEENGYYTFDFGGSFQDKIWAPGTSKTFNLTTDKKLENLDGLVNVFITQRMYLNSTEYGKQSLIGSSAEEPQIDSNGNYLPVIRGVRNKTITVKDPFNPLDGITAFDVEDGDLTSKIKVEGVVNNLLKGKYTVKYSVTDSKGATRTTEAIITVKNRTYIKEDDYDPTKTYNQGDIVVYQGRYYEVVWHTGTGYLPGSNNNIWADRGPAEVEIEDNIIDLATVASKYNMKKGDLSYSAECDLNSDGIIDLYDLVIISKNIQNQ